MSSEVSRRRVRKDLRRLTRYPLILMVLSAVFIGVVGCQQDFGASSEENLLAGAQNERSQSSASTESVQQPTVSPAITATNLPPAEIPPSQYLRFGHLTTEDGLSEGRVWGITQDSRGFMWFTTWEGLNRYDGYELKVFRQERENQNSPGGSGFFMVIEDRAGMIWAGSQTGGGLSRYDPSTEQ